MQFQNPIEDDLNIYISKNLHQIHVSLLTFCSSLIAVLRHDAIVSPREALTKSTVLRRDRVKVGESWDAFIWSSPLPRILAWKMGSKKNTTVLKFKIIQATSYNTSLQDCDSFFLFALNMFCMFFNPQELKIAWCKDDEDLMLMDRWICFRPKDVP